MARKKIPSIDELRDYREKQEAYLQDCIKNHKTFVISGPKFQRSWSISRRNMAVM